MLNRGVPKDGDEYSRLLEYYALSTASSFRSFE